MFRVKQVFEGHLIQKWHTFENAPFGIEPHTTAPLDWIIALFTLPFYFFTDQAFDWSGAFIGPLIACLSAFILFYLTSIQRNKVSWDWTRVPLLLTFALSPALIWATTIGRPDHQILIACGIFIALILEPLRWNDLSSPQSKIWHSYAGGIWGFILWVSLFEPLIFLLFTISFNLLFRRHENKFFLITSGIVIMIGVVVDGIRLKGFSLLFSDSTQNWLSTIGEIGSADLHWFLQFGLAIWLFPFFFWTFRQKKWWKKKELLFYLIAFLATLPLACLQLRWAYFFAITSALALFSFLSFVQNRGIRFFLLALHFLPIIWWNLEDMKRSTPPTELAELRNKIAPRISSSHRFPNSSLLAPWWLSPSLLYYSETPIVASSSHQSMDGILDSAEFFTTKNFLTAREILKSRNVQWLVLYYPERLYENSMQVLHGKRDTSYDVKRGDGMKIVFARLWRHIGVPPEYQIKYVSPTFQLFQIDLENQSKETKE